MSNIKLVDHEWDKTGITDTGDAVIKNNSVTISGTPSSDTILGDLSFCDKNDTITGFVEVICRSTGTTTTRIGARSINGSTNIYNMLDLNVNPNGAKTISVTDAGAWRSGIGVDGCVKMKNVSASVSTSLNAHQAKDVSLGTAPTSGATRIGLYAGNPSCVITNIWISNNVLMATVFNPTNTTQTIPAVSGQKVSILELYSV